MVNEMQFSPVAYKKGAKNNFYFTCRTLLPTFSLLKKKNKLVNKEWDKKSCGEEKVERKPADSFLNQAQILSSSNLFPVSKV